MKETLLFIADCALKGTIVMAVAALLASLARRSSAGTRHLIWLAAFLILLMLPLGEALVPARFGWLPQPPRAAALSPVPQQDSEITLPDRDLAALPQAPIETAPIEPIPAPSRVSRSMMAVATWVGGVLSICLYVFVGLSATLRLRLRSVPYERKDGLQRLKQRARVARPVDARVNRGSVPEVAMTWGSLWPVILLPRTSAAWPEEQEQAVLLHELAHVRRLDWLTQLLATFACALYWFNPIVWLAARRLRAESESSADDLVLRLGQCPSTYAASLLRVASELGARRPPLVSTGVTAMKSRKIEQRIQAILDPTRPRRGHTRLDLLAMAAVAAMVVVPLSGVKAQTPVGLALTSASLGQTDNAPSQIQKVYQLPDGSQNDLAPVQKFYELSKGSHREVVERRISGGSLVTARLRRTSGEFDTVDIFRLGDPSYIKRLARRGVHVTLIGEDRANAILAKQGYSRDRFRTDEAHRMAAMDQRLAKAEQRMAERQVHQAERIARIQASRARMIADRMHSMESRLSGKQQALEAFQAQREAEAGLKEAQAEIRARTADAAAMKTQAEKAREDALSKMQQELARQKALDSGARDQIGVETAKSLAQALKQQGNFPSGDSAKYLDKELAESSADRSKTLSALLSDQAATAKEMAQIRDEIRKSFTDQDVKVQALQGIDSARLRYELKQLQDGKADSLKGLDDQALRELQSADSVKLRYQLKQLQDGKADLLKGLNDQALRGLQDDHSVRLRYQLKGLQDSQDRLSQLRADGLKRLDDQRAKMQELRGADSVRLQKELKRLRDSQDWLKLRGADSMKGSQDLDLRLKDMQNRRLDWDRFDLSERTLRVDKAQREYAQAQQEYERMNKLYKAGSASQPDIQKQRSHMNIAKINLQIAKLMEEKAKMEGRH